MVADVSPERGRRQVEASMRAATAAALSISTVVTVTRKPTEPAAASPLAKSTAGDNGGGPDSCRDPGLGQRGCMCGDDQRCSMFSTSGERAAEAPPTSATSRCTRRRSRAQEVCHARFEDGRMRVKEEPEDDRAHVADAPGVVIRRRDVRRSRSIAGTAAAQEAGAHAATCSSGFGRGGAHAQSHHWADSRRRASSHGCRLGARKAVSAPAAHNHPWGGGDVRTCHSETVRGNTKQMLT
jgi:hypothetical protein